MQARTQKANSLADRPTHTEQWINQEIAGGTFPDERLCRRFGILLDMLSNRVGNTIPAACQDWANTKAAYRFLSNDRVTEQEILGGHFLATSDRASRSKGPLLVLHDTCEFSVSVWGTALDDGEVNGMMFGG